jgi:hypothetical protein
MERAADALEDPGALGHGDAVFLVRLHDADERSMTLRGARPEGASTVPSYTTASQRPVRRSRRSVGTLPRRRRGRVGAIRRCATSAAVDLRSAQTRSALSSAVDRAAARARGGGILDAAR